MDRRVGRGVYQGYVPSVVKRKELVVRYPEYIPVVEKHNMVEFMRSGFMYCSDCGKSLKEINE
jgi:hypothetical protein